MLPLPHSSHFVTAKRCFYTSQFSRNNFPLHSAVEKGDVEKVAEILKTDIIPINSKNHAGEWPLYIAAKKWHHHKDYPVKILELLQDYGACYLYDTDTKSAALSFVAKTNHKYSSITQEQGGWHIRLESVRQSINGCGFSIKECTNGCVKESKEYKAEFKAKIAYEALSSELSPRELAKKHGVKDWEVVKWRHQVRENLITLFEENKA